MAQKEATTCNCQIDTLCSQQRWMGHKGGHWKNASVCQKAPWAEATMNKEKNWARHVLKWLVLYMSLDKSVQYW